MEYGMIEGRSIEQLVAVLNVQVAEGWELAGSPVYDPRNRIQGGAGVWYAVVRKDPDRDNIRAAMQQYQELMKSMEHDRAELGAALDSLRRRLLQDDDQAAANPDKH